jgi:ABC-type multidrug transport system fused ATPase/permease subunit
MEKERVFSKRRNMRLPSAKDAFLARLNIVRKRMHWYTIAILIWLTFYLIYHLFLWDGISNAAKLLNATQSNPLNVFVVYHFSYIIFYAMLALAIIGIIAHYSRYETSARLRWGPLFGVAGAAVFLVGIVVFDYFQPPPPTMPFMSPFQAATLDVLQAFFYGPLLVGIPSYVEYLIEGPPAKIERVTRAALSQRLSSALTWYIEELDETINQMRKRIRVVLTLVTIALPIVFVAPDYTLRPYISDSHLYLQLLAALYVLSAVLFLILAVQLSSTLRKPRDAILALNHSDHFAVVATAERNALIKEARLRLAIFLLIFAHPVLFWPVSLVGHFPDPQNPILVPLTASLTMLLASALACFLLGFRALTQSRVAMKPFDTPALKGLLEPSIGILPAKVRIGEAHSVLMDFNLAAKSTTSCVRSICVFDSDQQPHYEATIQAAGATIDDDKPRAVFDGLCRNENVWDISFPNRGTQALHLLLNAVRARSDGDADRETLFAYVHNVLVEGGLTGSFDNTISSMSVVATVAGVLASALPFVPH